MPIGIVNDTGRHQSGLSVTFEAPGELEGAAIDAHEPPVLDSSRFGRWLGFAWRTPVPPDKALALTVPGRHDRERLRVEWVAPASGDRGDIVDEVERRLDAASGRAARSPEQQIAEAYFREFDHAVNPGLPGGPAERFANMIERGRDVLKQRVLARLHGRPADVALPRDEIAQLSQLQLDVVRRHFHCPMSPMIDSAYEWFVLGSLRQRKQRFGRVYWNGEPDGAYVFCFAEFAIMAIEQGRDVLPWTCMLNALVRMQELYLLAYGTGRPEPFAHYRSDLWHGVDPPRVGADLRTEDDVRGHFRSLYDDRHDLVSLREQARVNAVRAFSDPWPGA